MNVGLVTDAVDPERAAGAADERRLAGAELALDQHDIAGRKSRRELRGERLGLRWVAGLVAPWHRHMPM